MNTSELRDFVQDRYRDIAAHAHTAAADRRQDERFDVGRIPATIFLGGDEHAVGLRDLSASGAQIVDAPSQTSMGDTVVLVAPLGASGLLVIACDVVHVVPCGATNTLGLQFIARRDVDLETIESYITEVRRRHHVAAPATA